MYIHNHIYIHTCTYRYQDILISMTRSVLEKLQFHYNLVELREIDDDSIDSDVIDNIIKHHMNVM